MKTISIKDIEGIRIGNAQKFYRWNRMYCYFE